MSITDRPLPGQVHVRCVDLRGAERLAGGVLDQLEGALDSEERARAMRFRFAADRARFVVAHVGLRRLLGKLLRLAPAEVRLCQGLWGKPRLADDLSGLCFNMSHSRTLVVLAAATAEIGVDVEDISRDVDELGIGGRVFSNREQAEFQALPPGPARRSAFFGLWTRKEALLKALGTGFARDPSGIHLGIEGGRPLPWSDPSTGQRWTVAELPLPLRCRGALALQGEGLAPSSLVPPLTEVVLDPGMENSDHFE